MKKVNWKSLIEAEVLDCFENIEVYNLSFDVDKMKNILGTCNFRNINNISQISEKCLNNTELFESGFCIYKRSFDVLSKQYDDSELIFMMPLFNVFKKKDNVEFIEKELDLGQVKK